MTRHYYTNTRTHTSKTMAAMNVRMKDKDGIDTFFNFKNNTMELTIPNRWWW